MGFRFILENLVNHQICPSVQAHRFQGLNKAPQFLQYLQDIAHLLKLRQFVKLEYDQH